jgi:hypothetical protein
LKRPFVPDDKVSWSVDWPDYKPIPYTLDKIKTDKPIWADTPNPSDIHNFNKVDDKIDRKSHTGTYTIKNGLPLNPMGRTGVCERGQLGKWGVNHAADPIVTRYCILLFKSNI